MVSVSHTPARFTVLAGLDDGLTLELSFVDESGNAIDVSSWTVAGDKCSPTIVDGLAGRIDLVMDTALLGDFRWGFRRTGPTKKRMLSGRLLITEEPKGDTISSGQIQLVNGKVEVKVIT